MWLTPSERRALVSLVAILLVGASWDGWRTWKARAAPDLRLSSRREASDPWAAPAQGAAPAGPEALGAVGAPPGTVSPADAAHLDLNRATAADLDALPGIGPVLAGRIVARRSRAGPFRRPEDLLAVPGIGPRLLERLRPRIVVSGAPPSDPVHSAKRGGPGRADSASGSPGPIR